MYFYMRLPRKMFRKIKKIFVKKSRPVLRSPKPDDVWLISFPRSGVTWLSFLLANLMVRYCKKDIKVNFETIYNIVPDIHYKKSDIPENSKFAPFPRVIKSHSEYLSDYKRVIYLIRDPRDVMVSYYDYLTKRINGPRFKDFSEFIRDKSYGIVAWCKHLKSWMNRWDIIIRYEDFKKNPFVQLRKISSFLAINNIVESDIKFAVEKSSFKNMQLMERKEGMVKSKDFKKNFVFMRQGKIGVWKDLFNESDSEYYRRQVIRHKLYSFLKENDYL